MQKTEIEKALEEKANTSFNQAVEQQALYGRLTNWRANKVDNIDHKAKVLAGYYKTLAFLLKRV